MKRSRNADHIAETLLGKRQSERTLLDEKRIRQEREVDQQKNDQTIENNITDTTINERSNGKDVNQSKGLFDL